MTNILHLSSTFLSGYPGRLSKLLNTDPRYRSRCITGLKDHPKAKMYVDLVAGEMSTAEIADRVNWADIIHLHGVHSLGFLGTWGVHEYKGKRFILQTYEHPEEDIGRDYDVATIPAGIPYIITPACSWARWPTASFLAPEVPHFYAGCTKPQRLRPLISVDTKHMPEIQTYRDIVSPLRDLQSDRKILYYPIENRISDYVVTLKEGSDVGIGDIVMGRYNLSALDYAAAGVMCYCRIRGHARDNIEILTGTATVPWVPTDRDHFLSSLQRTIDRRLWVEQGVRAKEWMEEYWNRDMILRHYDEAYQSL